MLSSAGSGIAIDIPKVVQKSNLWKAEKRKIHGHHHGVTAPSFKATTRESGRRSVLFRCEIRIRKGPRCRGSVS
ncbi:hypothetical protein AND_010532 [Anopheles darlingi]|uniref:Uncharacterized protein n=1 Tax=Anopheles darlingi TaxID=43151 RepID=W5J542_ANODA|nr:hypothetical protein AND_010532 [Anopheles darlingi]